MRKLIILLLMLLTLATLPSRVEGQTTVNLTVSDTPDAQTWNNGTWAVQLIGGTPGQTSAFTITSGGGSLANQNGSLSGTGTASMVLPATANIAPANTRWQFYVCSQQGTACFQSNVVVSTSSPQTLTLNPPSIRIAALPYLPPVAVYTTTEISSAAIGSQITLLGSTPSTPALQICTAVSGITCTTWVSSGGTGATLAGNANSIYLSPACTNPSSGNCFFVNDNTRYVIDGSWSGTIGVSVSGFVFTTATTGTCGGTTVTISGGDTPFTSADTGKTCYGVGTGPVSTGVFVLGTDDTALINAAYAAVIALPHCGSLVLPSGYMMISGPIFTTPTPNACVNLNQDGAGIQITGQGEHATYFVPRPDTTFSAAGLLIGFLSGTQASQLFDHFQVFGATATLTNGAGKTILGLAQASLGFRIAVTQLSGVASSYTLSGQEDSCMQCFTDTAGGPIIISGNVQMALYSNFSSTGLNVAAGSSLFDFGGVYNANNSVFVPHTISGIFHGKSTTFTNPFTSASNALSIANAAAQFSCEDCTITDNTNAGSQGIAWTAAGSVRLVGYSSVSGGTAAGGGAILNTGVPGAILYIEPTVKFSPVTFPNWTGIVQGPAVFQGQCTGVVTASSTLGLYGLGNQTPTCTGTTVNQGKIVSTVGINDVLTYLRCTSTAAGVNASSGAATVLKNNAATALTCTIGTGTSCVDNTHSAAYALGDNISIQFTTQAADTLAGVACSVLVI